MSSKWKGKKLKLVAALVFLVVYGIASLPPAQATQADATKDIKTAPASIAADEESRLKSFLDKDGGYKDKLGGYYNPKAGTYTDKDGGILDNWGGYTYSCGLNHSRLTP